MRKTLALLALLPVLASAGTFVSDPASTLPGPKSDLRAVPAGADPNKYQTAGDYNALRSASLDLRAWAYAPWVAQSTPFCMDGATCSASWKFDGTNMVATRPVAVDLSPSTVTATGSTTARALKDRFSDVVRVADFLPVGYVTDGTVDYTTQFQAAIDKALGDGTSPARVYAPFGKFKVTSLRAYHATTYRGVWIVGEGVWGTTLYAGGTTSTDVLSFARPDADTDYGYGGGVTGLSIVDPTAVYPALPTGIPTVGTKARDLISIVHWVGAELIDVRLIGGNRDCIFIRNSVTITGHKVDAQIPGRNGLTLTGPEIFNTTIYFSRFHVAHAFANGADVWGNGVVFTQAVIEYCGFGTAGVGTVGWHGIRQRSGSLDVTDSYFEGNWGADVYFGSSLGTDAIYQAIGSVKGGYFSSGGGSKAAGQYAIEIERSNGITIEGGDFSEMIANGRLPIHILDGSVKAVRVVGMGTHFQGSRYVTIQSNAVPPRSGLGIYEVFDTVDFSPVITGMYRSEPGLGVRLGGSLATMTSGAAAPTTGAHVVGEIVWNTAPAGGGVAGWFCTTAGTGTAAKWSPLTLGAQLP